ncbi:aminotransferase class I/II-fold pyridoxal phosphate-dependent enzyme [Aerococcus sanguinicola]|uniref:aminotransferase class I/II-fold pyridoxal phosphate-dependent enzyme n=1 Tax=unclassified Aerococcus TaxID=2618060 RepID=UPI0008A54522|nr:MULTISPECIES: aminotransferase class I/II-fold pyridoxal phosphate-dependent enzyme [unclassified Aerococcus]MDK6233354.1 aminotransferase class I/II-fold pyridoxal phosphate-dependent enzyme [Aerococcus sp. UMB10185]MDK6804982.1 aminotransferase class I/II-fold pyridoxal phosphate-dependent enzyme [Aerococcus sp. UMB7834]MDK6855183.1 aminotransferase class I/II-fold pyridoxal phosphate-dependent enzyme [Aerococcus sp. UMB7533]MDK8501903.1 aminotransferase class I/II-fold pyridoxal phosphate
MTKSLNQTVLDMAPSGIRRFFNVANEVPGVISLGVGEPDFDTPWTVRQAAIKSLRQGRTFYTANAGLIELRKEIAKYIDRHYGLHYDPEEEQIVTIGGSEAIDLACRVLINPGDEVIVMDPSYVSYLPSVQLAGGVPVPVRLKAEDKFVMQAEQLEAAITDKTKAIILNYPNNPTGAVCLREDIEALAQVIKDHDLYCITDEIYSEIWYADEPYTSIASIPGMKERTVYINGFAKAFSMTGWRLGYVCAPKEITEQMLKVHQYTIMAAPTTSQYAGITALKECDDEVADMRDDYLERRNFLMSRYREMGLPCFVPEGAFYTFPDIREFGLTSEEFALELLDREKVAVVPGSAFGESGDGFLRISYAYSIKELERAMDKIENFVKELRAEKA